MRRSLASAVVALLLSSAPSLAQEVGKPLDETVIHWRATPGNPELVALEVESLYISLYDSDLLTTEPYIDKEGLTVVEILRQQRRYAGNWFPFGIDRVMCELNPQVCTLSADESIASWTNGVNSTINLPNVMFEDTIDFVEVPTAVGTTLGEVVNGVSFDCTEWETTCLNAIKQLNRSNFDKNGILVRPMVTVPQYGYEAAVAIKADASLSDEAFVGILPPIVTSNTISIGGGPLSFESVGGPYEREKLFDQQALMFDRIGFRWGGVSAFDRDPPPDGALGILVVDGFLDQAHCELARFKVLHNLSGPEDLRLPVACGKPGVFSKPDDHGSHVAGILGAAVDGEGTAGLVPRMVNLFYRAVDTDELATDAAQRAFRNALRSDFFDNGFHVANLSWKYTSALPTDRIRITLQELNEVLFVVAAGNNRKTLGGNCDVLPACFTDLPNVLTVVGLDSAEDPHPWVSGAEGTNQNVAFHLGAIADSIVSTSRGNRIAVTSGTSQAAPQVAAAAVLVMLAYQALFETETPLSPPAVRNRLIYTTDLSRRLFDVASGGRLNIDRALQVNVDQVVVRSGNQKVAYRGELRHLGSGTVGCGGGGPAAALKRDALERMVWDPVTRRFVLFLRSDHSDPSSDLIRETDCVLTEGSAISLVTFEDERVGEVTFPLDSILDFTASMH